MELEVILPCVFAFFVSLRFLISLACPSFPFLFIVHCFSEFSFVSVCFSSFAFEYLHVFLYETDLLNLGVLGPFSCVFLGS